MSNYNQRHRGHRGPSNNQWRRRRDDNYDDDTNYNQNRYNENNNNYHHYNENTNNSYRSNHHYQQRRQYNNNYHNNTNNRYNQNQRQSNYHNNYNQNNYNRRNYNAYDQNRNYYENNTYQQQQNNNNYNRYYHQNNNNQYQTNYNRRQYQSNRSYFNKNNNNNNSNKQQNPKRPSIGPQPHGVSFKRLNNFSLYKYWVTEKSDGVRFICYINSNGTYFLNRKWDIFGITHCFYCDGNDENDGLSNNTILDGELITAQINNKLYDEYVVAGFNKKRDSSFSAFNSLIFKYYHQYKEYDQLIFNIFDCMIYNGLRVINENSSSRFKQIDKFIKKYNKKLLKYNNNNNNNDNNMSWSDISKQENNENLKDYIWKLIKDENNNNNNNNNNIDDDDDDENDIYYERMNIFNILNKKLPLIFIAKTRYKSIRSDMIKLFSCIKKKDDDNNYYYIDPITGIKNKNDGIVFTPENNGYFMNRLGDNCDNLRKWKPTQLNTIDVKIMINKLHANRNIIDKFIENGIIKLYVNDYINHQYVIFDKIDISTNDGNDEFEKEQKNILIQIYNEVISNIGYNKLHFLIVECCYDLKYKSWKILKWRKDKTTPNTLNVCKHIGDIINNNMSSNDLIEACPINYEQLQIINNYNSKAIYHSIDERDKMITKHIRDMNNWCKYVMITESIRDSYSNNNNIKINILDLGCGKGGDLRKCRGNKKYVAMYIGIDLASKCIERAKNEYNKMKQESILHRNDSNEIKKKFGLNNPYGQTMEEFYYSPLFDAEFICYDMNKYDLSELFQIKKNKPFHLINIQFALHYAFGSKLSLKSFLNTIKLTTKSKSYFICSFVRDDIIIKRLMENEKDNDDDVVFFNKFQSITMKKDDFKWIKNIYEKYKLMQFDVNQLYLDNNDNINIDDDIDDKLIGIPYIYYQMNSVENVEEYLLSFWFLCKLLWKHCRMKLIYKKTHEIIKKQSSDVFPYKYGFEKRQLPSKWTHDEQQVLDTYAYALFKRV